MGFNNQWIEIFKPGDYGDKGKYSLADLDTIVGNFDATKWQPVLTPPVQIGHADTAPALGLVKALRRTGEALEAQFEKVHPQLEEVVRDGRFPNRSVGLYRNPEGKGLMLRHVAFLGAVPPEVKGLQPVKFSDGDYVAIDFTEEVDVDANTIKSTVATEIREFFSKLFGERRPDPPALTEVQVTERFNQLFAEKSKPLTDKIAALETENKTLREGTQTAAAAARVAEVRAFAESLRQQGKWVPALDPILPVIESAAADGRVVKFNEGTAQQPKEVELPAVEAFKRFAGALGQIVPLGELAGAKAQESNVIQFSAPTSEKVAVDAESVALAEAVQKRAEEIQKNNPKMAFHEAFAQAHTELRRKNFKPAGAIASGQA